MKEYGLLKRHLVDVKLYSEISYPLRLLINPETINFYFFYARSSTVGVICDSNMCVFSDEREVMPTLWNLIKHYVLVMLRNDSDALERYAVYSNYLRYDLSGQVQYHIFSMNSFFDRSHKESFSVSENELIECPSKTFCIASIPVDELDVLHSGFREIAEQVLYFYESRNYFGYCLQ